MITHARKFVLVVALASCATSAVAFAQASPPPAPSDATPGANAAGATPNVSATGQHMPDVGVSNSAGVTPFDRKQERKMSKETTICKGC